MAHGTAAVRISAATRTTVDELASKLAKSKKAILEAAVEEYRRLHFFKEADEAYAALRADAAAWQAELDERELWDATLADGLSGE